MNDLLGGDFWVDIDQFAQRDFADPNLAQNDLQNINNIIEVGDVFGYNYDIHINKNEIFGEYNYNKNKIESFFGLTLSNTAFWRNGKMQNGRFPNSSLGESEKQNFTNYGLKIGIFRAGCLTGPNHSGAGLHGFLSYLVKSCVINKSYQIIGYKGKQVRDNLHSNDLIKAFWEFIKKPKNGEVYNIGGGKYSNCSIIEALKYIENKTKIKIKKQNIKQNRVGDHIWYVSSMKKFKRHYPNWKQEFSTKKILDELIKIFI